MTNYDGAAYGNTMISNQIKVYRWHFFTISKTSTSQSASIHSYFSNTEIATVDLTATMSADIPPSAVLYFGARQNYRFAVGQSIDGIVQELFFAPKCMTNTDFLSIANGLTQNMDLLGAFIIQGGFSQVIPNAYSTGVVGLEHLTKGVATSTGVSDVIADPGTGYHIFTGGQVIFSESGVFTLNYEADLVRHYISFVIDLRFPTLSGVLTERERVFTIDTHLKIQFAVNNLNGSFIILDSAGTPISNSFMTPATGVAFRMGCSIGFSN